MAVERFKCRENIEWLAKELGVPRQLLQSGKIAFGPRISFTSGFEEMAHSCDASSLPSDGSQMCRNVNHHEQEVHRFFYEVMVECEQLTAGITGGIHGGMGAATAVSW